MKASHLPWLVPTLIAVAALTAYGEASMPPQVGVARPSYLRALAPREMPAAPRGNPFALVLAPQGEATAASSAGQPGAAPPAPSLSPPLGWRTIGKQFDEQQGWAVFLARGEETRVVRHGDILDDHLRVVAIQPPLMTLQHLKKRTRLTLDIGEAKE